MNASDILRSSAPTKAGGPVIADIKRLAQKESGQRTFSCLKNCLVHWDNAMKSKSNKFVSPPLPMHVVNASVLKETSICTSKWGIVAGRSAVAQCMEHLTLNREKSGFESCASVSNCVQFRSLYVAAEHSVVKTSICIQIVVDICVRMFFAY